MAFIQTTAHRGTENLPFFAKRKRAGERLQAVPAREKIKGRGSAPGHGRMSSTERLTGQGSGHSPKPRAVVVYGPSPGHLFLQRRAYKPDKEAGTAQSQGPLLSTAPPRGTFSCNAGLTGRTRKRALPKAKGRCCLWPLPGAPFPATQGLQAGQGSGHCPPRTPPRGKGALRF